MLNNWRGDVVTLVRNGQVSWRYDYSAFGVERDASGGSTSGENAWAARPKPNNPFRFGMGYTDVESGLVYLRNRYLMPEVGRFITADPFWNIGNMQDGLLSIRQASNLYSFVLNNPITFVDPSGLRLEIAATPGRRDIIMSNLQQLTNDTLSWTECWQYNVWIVGYNSASTRGVDLPAGTGMIRRLINNAQTVTIRFGANVLGRSNVIQSYDGGGSTVYFNPNQQIRTITSDWSGNNPRYEVMPSFIVLGHELIHALRHMGGNSRTGEVYLVNVPPNYDRRISREEAETIGLDHWRDGVMRPASTWLTTENALRREQNRAFGMRLRMRTHHEPPRG